MGLIRRLFSDPNERAIRAQEDAAKQLKKQTQMMKERERAARKAARDAATRYGG